MALSFEMFIYRPDDAPRRSVTELRDALAGLGVPCRIEQYEDIPSLLVEGSEMDMTLTVDDDGTATSAMLQWTLADSNEAVESVCRAFEKLGWSFPGPEYWGEYA